MNKFNNISVIIPAHNAEKTLPKTLKSLKEQSTNHFEIIVVDDGSTDTTAEIANNFVSEGVAAGFSLRNIEERRLKPAATSLRLKLITTANRGPAAARNTGIKHASGEIIALLDSDCQAERTWIENIYKVFNGSDISVIMGKVIVPESDFVGDSISALGFPAGGSIGFDKVWKVSPEGYTNTLSACNCAFRKEVFNKLGHFDEDFPYAGGEDTLFAVKIVKLGLKIKYCPNVKVFHESRTSLLSFMRWQIKRGKCAFQFKQKVGTVKGFAFTRLWSTKNAIAASWTSAKFPLILLLIFASYALQTTGFIIEFLEFKSGKNNNVRNYTFKEIRKWYEQVYIQNPNRFIRNWKSYNRFLRPVNPCKGKKLLDVACGAGGLLKAASRQGLVPFGLDISTKSIVVANIHNGCDKSVVADGETIPYKSNSFDYVTNIGSLEHFLNPKNGLREMGRVLKNEGTMCIVLPNSFGLLGKLIGYGGTGQIVEKLATLKEWESFLESEQFKVTSVDRDTGPKILHDMKPHKILLRLAAKIISPILPKSFAYQFIFACQKNGNLPFPSLLTSSPLPVGEGGGEGKGRG